MNYSVGLTTLEQRDWSGGIASHVEGLASALWRAGVYVKTSWGVGVGDLARFHPFQFYPTLFSAMLNLRGADLVHAHDPRLARLGGSLRRPVVTTFHGYMPLEMRVLGNGRANRFLVRACERFVQEAVIESDAIIAVDNRIAHWLWRDYGAKNIHMIPNGVDTEVFSPKPVSSMKTPVEMTQPNIPEVRLLKKHPGPTVLFAKAFTPKNGPKIAWAAGQIIEREVPDSLFLMTQAMPHGAMPDLLREADVVIVPSVPIGGVEEATSIFALEAMASGCAVVASDIGGLRQLIDSGENGILVPPGDSEILAEYVIDLLHDDQERECLGRRAREYVVANHTWVHVAQETMKVYEEMLI